MLTKNRIEQFYEDVSRLDLRFPVSAISRATGYSKGNVSEYMSRKKEPSESFLKAFYGAFPEISKSVLNNSITNGAGAPMKSELQDRIADLEALISVIASAVAELISATSGENREVVKKKFYKAAEDLRKLDK